MDASFFKDVASAIQSVAIAAGVVVAGVWTAYLHLRLKAAERVDLEFSPGIALDMSAEVLRHESTNSPSLAIRLELRNTGKKALVYNVDVPTLGMRRIEDLEKGSASAEAHTWKRVTALFLTEAPSDNRHHIRYLRPGDIRHVVYLSSVSEPGTYLLQVRLPYEEMMKTWPRFDNFAIEQLLVQVCEATQGEA